MEFGTASITVLFEDPFWIGLFQREWPDGYQVCKIVFGPEPKDYEVYHYLLQHWSRLQFGPSMEGGECPQGRINPKRLQRQIRKQLSQPTIGTKAQQALQQQREAHKSLRQTAVRQRREEEADRRFLLRQEKKKAKHKGH